MDADPLGGGATARAAGPDPIDDAPTADSHGAPAPDAGSAAVWVLACGLAVLAIAAGVEVRAVAELALHRAEGAADLAALAGAGRIGVVPAVDPCTAAARVAALDGVQVRACRVRLAPDGRSGTVTVVVSRAVVLPWVDAQAAVAGARAARLPAPVPAPVPATPAPARTTPAPR